MGFDAQPLPPAAENRKHPHRTGDETAAERIRGQVQGLCGDYIVADVAGMEEIIISAFFLPYALDMAKIGS